MRRVGEVIALFMLVIFMGVSLWCAIPDAKSSPVAPDATPYDNMAGVCCYVQEGLYPKDNKPGDPLNDEVKYSKTCKKIVGAVDETCWCQCAEDEFGFASPICGCFNFFDDDLNGPWDDDV